MFRFWALLTAILHDRTALPSRITVQQPHCERPHPNLGPFNLRLSRNTYSSGVLGSVSTTRDLPFTFSETRAITRFLPQGTFENERPLTKIQNLNSRLGLSAGAQHTPGFPRTKVFRLLEHLAGELYELHTGIKD